MIWEAHHHAFMYDDSDHDVRARNGSAPSQQHQLDMLLASADARRDEQDAPVCPPDLDRAILDALRVVACATSANGGPWAPDHAARQRLDIVCAIARRDALRAEQLLILLKHRWRALPEAHRVARLDADLTLACVVTHCIEAFYRPSRPADR